MTQRTRISARVVGTFTCALTVKLRGRTTTPDERRGRTLSFSARGAKQEAPHGPLQRLLDVSVTTRLAKKTYRSRKEIRRYAEEGEKRCQKNHRAEYGVADQADQDADPQKASESPYSGLAEILESTA